MESNTDPTIAGSREESIKMDSRRDPAIAGPKERRCPRLMSEADITTMFFQLVRRILEGNNHEHVSCP